MIWLQPTRTPLSNRDWMNRLVWGQVIASVWNDGMWIFIHTLTKPPFKLRHALVITSYLINDYIYEKQCDIITNQCPNFVELRAWINSDIPYKFRNAITYRRYQNVKYHFHHILCLQKIVYTVWDLLRSGGRLNKKDGLTRYGDSHVKDKTS